MSDTDPNTCNIRFYIVKRHYLLGVLYRYEVWVHSLYPVQFFRSLYQEGRWGGGAYVGWEDRRKRINFLILSNIFVYFPYIN